MKKYTKAIYTGAAAILIGLVAFTATAFAATAAAPDDGSLLDLLKPVVSAVTSGEYVYASALALVLVVAAIRKYGSERVKFFATEAGAAVLVLAGSFASAIATTLGNGGSLSYDTARAAALIAVAAAGGFAIAKELVFKPLIAKYGHKLPRWAQPVLALVSWVFDRPTRIETAESAGEKAVESKPSNGVSGVVGEPDDIA